MTKVLITVDTELSALLHKRGASIQYNMDSSIWGKCREGRFGIEWQMDVLEAHGLKGVFFVDSLPGIILRNGILPQIVKPIIDRGHEVQMHIHTEWVDWIVDSPTGSRRGRDLADYSLSDQIVLLDLCAEMLENAGAPRPIAFRAGNYGANDNSLRALAEIGLKWDSSFNAAYLGDSCHISLPTDQLGAIEHCNVIELPVSGLHDSGTQIRPAQVCALSSAEMRAALLHSAKEQQDTFVIVSHSFEMLSRDRSRPNYAVMRRFEAMCDVIAKTPELVSAGFHDLDPAIALAPRKEQTRLGPNRLRTGLRMAEQAIATWLYERQLRPV